MVDIVGAVAARSVPDLASYDTILVFLSGGKDSIAALDAVLTAGERRQASSVSFRHSHPRRNEAPARF
jgi:tRNA(Ile)-lysidine synthase TilS/MesJ